MTFEETLGAMLDAKLAPLRSDLERVTAELVAVRRSLPPMFVTQAAAAKAMGCSVKTVQRRVKAGEWPSRRDGGRVLVDLSALKPMSDEEVARASFELRAIAGGRKDGST